MKLTLELDNGFKNTVNVEGMEPTLKNMQDLCILLDDWYKEWIKDND